MKILEIDKVNVTAWHDGVVFTIRFDDLRKGEKLVGQAWNGFKVLKMSDKGTLSEVRNGSCYAHLIFNAMVDALYEQESDGCL